MITEIIGSIVLAELAEDGYFMVKILDKTVTANGESGYLCAVLSDRKYHRTAVVKATDIKLIYHKGTVVSDILEVASLKFNELDRVERSKAI